MDFSREDIIICEENYWPCPDCDNQPEVIREGDLYCLRCTGCDRQTDFYATIKEAELAWKHDIETEFPEMFDIGHEGNEQVIREITF